MDKVSDMLNQVGNQLQVGAVGGGVRRPEGGGTAAVPVLLNHAAITRCSAHDAVWLSCHAPPAAAPLLLPLLLLLRRRVGPLAVKARR
jgi:hypothetical protein